MEDKYQFAQAIVREAGEFLRQHLHDPLVIQQKSHFTDLATQLDCQVEEELTQKIIQRYPNDRILGEEGGQRVSINEKAVWIIDPIDGTTNFIVQQEDFAVMIAYYENGVGKFGIIYDVMKDQMIHGGKQFPVCENNQPLPSFQDKSLQEGLFGLNTGLYAQNVHGLADLANQMLGTRSLGSAGLSFARVLKGQFLAHASYLYPWDYAAASILGEELGYRLMSIDGQAPRFDGREVVFLYPIQKEAEMIGYLQ